MSVLFKVDIMYISLLAKPHRGLIAKAFNLHNVRLQLHRTEKNMKGHALPETNSSHLKIGHPSKKISTDPWKVPPKYKCDKIRKDFLHKQVVEGLGYVPRVCWNFLRIPQGNDRLPVAPFFLGANMQTGHTPPRRLR